MAKQASKAVQRAAINRQTWQQRMKSYRRTPVSLLLFLLVCSAAVITVGVLALLIGYILVKGLPNLHPSLLHGATAQKMFLCCLRLSIPF